MKRVLPSCLVLLLFCAGAAHAQLYKSVGPDGKVTYSDTPPASAAKVESKSLATGGVSTAGFPFELQEATKNHPVTLYTTGNCAPCDDGRKMLSARGVPFIEKTVNTREDAEKFRQVAGDGSFPLLVIGRSSERGFDAGAWNKALSIVGYPETSRLPRSYQNPPAEAAAPVPKQAEAKPQTAGKNENAASKPAATELPPATGNAPPGFRF